VESKTPEFHRRLTGSLVAGAICLLSRCPAARGDDVDLPGPATESAPVTQPATETPPTPADFSDKLTGDWGGLRTKLANAGINIGADLYLEGFANFQGGLDTAHLVGSTTCDLNFTFDLEKLVNIRGGEFYFDLEDHAFRNPSTALVGELQTFDPLNSPPYLEVAEVWYQQKLFNDKLRLKIGKVDANSEFSVIDNGLSFLNDTTQVSPTIFPMPTTPDPMPSINVFLTPVDWFFAGFGAYYANQSDRFGELIDNPASMQPTRFGAFLIGEVGVKWQTTEVIDFPGNLKVGAWGDTGTFEKFDGAQKTGTQGIYAIIDQTLYQPSDQADSARGVRTFLTYGLTQSDINPIDESVGGGFTDTGPDIGDPNDCLGIGAQYAHLSAQARPKFPYELAIEAFVKHQFAPGVMFQPDLQYILHPAGNLPDALVLTLRVEFDF
jgi:porin